MPHVLRFHPGRRVDCLYTDAIDLRVLGPLHVVRATVILFCGKSQEWLVRCAATGVLLHTNPSREACLAWEQQHLQPGSENTAPPP